MSCCQPACCKKYYTSIIASCCQTYQITLLVEYFDGITPFAQYVPSGNSVTFTTDLTTIRYTITNIGNSNLYSTQINIADNLFPITTNASYTLQKNIPLVITQSVNTSTPAVSRAHSVLASVYVDTKKKKHKCKKYRYERWITANYVDNIIIT
jgi:hypothetical protein